MRKTLIVLALAMPLAACQSGFLKEYVEAANDLDPKCGKRVHVTVMPLVTPIGVFPMIKEATYDKGCNLDQFNVQPSALRPLAPGLTVGGNPQQ